MTGRKSLSRAHLHHLQYPPVEVHAHLSVLRRLSHDNQHVEVERILPDVTKYRRKEQSWKTRIMGLDRPTYAFISMLAERAVAVLFVYHCVLFGFVS